MRLILAIEFSLFVLSAIVGIATGSISGDAEDGMEATLGTLVFLNVCAALGAIAALVWRWAL